MQIERRTLLKAAAAAVVIPVVPSFADEPALPADPWQRTWRAALATLNTNVAVPPHFDAPVLFEGPMFRGIWLECGPHESLEYADLAPFVTPGTHAPVEVARNSHRAFFVNQKADGQFPAYMNHYTGLNFGQIQMVVPIAATAWELSRRLKDESFLLEAYAACSRWDDWLRAHRDTRRTGLVEAFCTFDTGHDNSPRFRGVPDECPGKDAKRVAQGSSVPRLAPDLSATTFGSRVALAAMARALGKRAEAREWSRRAEEIRRLIIERLWCEEDASFYDVAPDGAFVKVRSDVNTRVLGEHVLRLDVPRERRIFNALWERQLGNPNAFWSRYPFPSIALDDPGFVRPIPFNSWGGASQALTALRTLRWMDHYGKSREQGVLMERWCEVIVQNGFIQQVDPVTGEATKSPIKEYSPAALCFLQFAKRLGRAPRPVRR